MKRFFALIAFIPLLSIACNSAELVVADERDEPVLKYSVKVGEKIIAISEGETVQLEGTFTNPTIAVTPEPYRVFPYQGLTFKYPRSFTFEADLEDRNAKNWTLSGNDFKILYFVLSASLSTAEFANKMIDQFGRENAKVANANATITLGKEKLTGTSLRIKVATHSMVMDIYRIPSRGKTTKLLVFQDSLDDSGNRSKEGKETLAEITSSFTVEQ